MCGTQPGRWQARRAAGNAAIPGPPSAREARPAARPPARTRRAHGARRRPSILEHRRARGGPRHRRGHTPDRGSRLGRGRRTLCDSQLQVVANWRTRHRFDVTAFLPQLRNYVGVPLAAALAPLYVSTWEGFQCDLSPWLLAGPGNFTGARVGQPLAVYAGHEAAGNNLAGHRASGRLPRGGAASSPLRTGRARIITDFRAVAAQRCLPGLPR